MPDSRAGSWAALNGSEVVNSQRTVAYIQNFKLPITVDEECWCPRIMDLLGDCPNATGAGPDGEYTFPSEDPAPWYDPAIPESGDFLGFLVTEFDGLGSTYTRSAFDVLSGGAVLGKLRPQARVLQWRGYLFGRTCCAADYGLRWLTAQLAGGVCDDCSDSELDILLCCPAVTGDTEIAACGNAQNAAVTSCETGNDLGEPPASQPSKNADAFRTFHKAGLLAGPIKVSTRTLGCGSCEDEGSGCIVEAEFQMIVGNPFMHKDPICVCEPTAFPVCEGCNEDGSNADLDFWQKVTTSSYPASEDDTAACASKLECTSSPADCNQDPNCPTAKLPTIPEVQDECGCESIFNTENCCYISNDHYGPFFEAVAQINIFSGDRPLQNVTIKFYENPQERPCTDEDLFDVCNLCDFITVRYVPAYSTLSIDGLTKRVSITCPGENVQPAESLLTSNFRWPVLKCTDYIIKIGADCCRRSAISFVRRAQNGVNINTFTGSGQLILENTNEFPASGTVTVELSNGNKFSLTYTGKSGSALTGVNSNGQSGVLSTGDKVIGPDIDPDCTQGVSPDARTSVTIIPREM